MNGLERPFHSQVRMLRRTVLPALAGHVEALHRARVASRRLRELCPLVAAQLGQTKVDRVRRRVRRVTRALGAVREVDVALAALDETSRDEPSQLAAIARVRQHLVHERDTRRKRMLTHLTPVNIEKLDKQLTEMGHDLRGGRFDEAGRERLAERISRRARRVLDAVGEAGALYQIDRVHAVRISVKKLRYALEISTETRVARAAVAVRQLKAVQDTLGRLHDLEVLMRCVLDVQVRSDPQLAGHQALDALRYGIEDECRQLHGQYVGQRARIGKICERAILMETRICPWRGREPLSARRRPDPLAAARFPKRRMMAKVLPRPTGSDQSPPSRRPSTGTAGLRPASGGSRLRS